MLGRALPPAADEQRGESIEGQQRGRHPALADVPKSRDARRVAPGCAASRTHLRGSLGFTNRAAHSRAVAELERLGLIEVRRRKGYAPLVRLVPQRAGEGGQPDR